MALMGNCSQLPSRLQLLIDSLPCFTTLFEGYLPLQLYLRNKILDECGIKDEKAVFSSSNHRSETGD
jgi:16S rRNA C1402 (ribose-2'-O) methylase RsmI